MTTIAPPWSGYPTRSGFTPACSPSPSPAPTRAVSHPNHRARLRGATRPTLAPPVNRASTASAKQAAVRLTVIAAARQPALQVRAAVANARPPAAASVTTKRPGRPTIAAAWEGCASGSPVRATASGAPGPVGRNATGTRTARRASASTGRAPRVAARPTRIARRALAASASAWIASATPTSPAPRGAPVCRGCASRSRRRRRPRHRRLPRPTDPSAGKSLRMGFELFATLFASQ